MTDMCFGVSRSAGGLVVCTTVDGMAVETPIETVTSNTLGLMLSGYEDDDDMLAGVLEIERMAGALREQAERFAYRAACARRLLDSP